MLQTADYLLMQNSTGIQHHISNMPFGLLHPSESQTVIPLHCEKHNDVKKKTSNSSVIIWMAYKEHQGIWVNSPLHLLG